MRMRPFYRFSRGTVRLVFRLLWGLRVEGLEKIPRQGGMILAVNHASYADPMVAAAGSPRELRFFAKRELFRNPFFGGLIRACGAFPVDRGSVGRETLQTVQEILTGGGALLVFPEGTRSLDGKIRDARPGIGMMAARANVPVVPTYLRGTRGIGGGLRRRGTLGVFFGDPVEPGAAEGGTRKEVQRRIGELAIERIRALQAIYG
ncbi:MAG: lysophospholipid acyltransferase family protein [Candidatus Eisenbacteria bacterium]